MPTKNSRDLDASVQKTMADARGQEDPQNDANTDSDRQTRVGGSSRGWGKPQPPGVKSRKGK